MAGLDTIRELPRAYRRLGRFRTIMHVLMRYGFDSIVEVMRNRYGRIFQRFIHPWRESSAEMRGKSVGERTRLMLVELGPTFVKLGQILASRQDIFPKSFTDELVKLQDLLDDDLGTYSVAESPSRHCVRFRETVYDNCPLFHARK